MNMSVRLNNLAAVSTGSARAVFESADAAYHAIFEGEDDELAELSELGNELGDDLGMGNDAQEGEPTGEAGTPEGAEQDAGNNDEQPAEPEQPEETTQEPEQQPENVNAQSQPASISADALIKELTDLKYPEKIREVAQQMKQSAKGTSPTTTDMLKPVAQAISKYMAKKGYAAMQKEDAIRVVKTIIMAATDVGKQAGQKQPEEETENAAQ